MAELTILEALDNLNALVDVDSLDQIEVTEEAQLIPHLKEEEEEGEFWLKAGADELTHEAIKETFKCVHAHLVHFYEQMRARGDAKRLIEGINSVMVLVGEAAHKIDRDGPLFHQKIIEFPEYQELQAFYKRDVIQQLFRDFAKAPVIQPAEEAVEEETSGIHLLNDLDLIKGDHLYELFYLKNEVGHDFYTLGLARTIKLACDFGEYAKMFGGEDPFVQVKNWEDRALHLLAKEMLKGAHKEIAHFYRGARAYRDMEIVQLLHCSLMALMLAANPRNLLRQFARKGCHLYFADFQLFLRAVLHTREYERFLIYQPPQEQPFFQRVMALIFALTEQFFSLGEPLDEVEGVIERIVPRFQEGKGCAENLHLAQHALEEELAHHPSGPVFKTLDLIRSPDERHFDPLLLGNIPTKECTLPIGIDLIRMPAPVRQTVINKAEIVEEFKAFLRALEQKGGHHHLFLNFQDRTSWREHARSTALEELGRQAEFASVLTVVTLAKDTEFYNQEGVYRGVDSAQEFKEQFAHHLSDPATGYSFPPHLQERLFPTWIVSLLDQIHQTFFDGKELLVQEERVDYISLAYYWIELKVIELVQPTSLTHGSKDGLDLSATATAGLLALLADGKEWDASRYRQLLTLLYAPTLLLRERGVHPERIARLESAIRRMESCAPFLKSFAHLYERNWENGGAG